MERCLVNNSVKIVSEEDWALVKSTTLGSDIKGLKKVGQVHGKAWSPLGRSAEKREQIAMEQIKRNAAALGSHIILIESKVIDINGFLQISGSAYTF